MNFSSDAMADFEDLLEVNRKICKQQMAENASPTLPTNCAVLPKTFIDLCMAGNSTISERLNLIRRQQKVVHAQMAQLQSTLDMLDYKEWYYLTAQQAGACAIHATLPEAEIPEKFRAIRQRTKGTGEKQKV